MNCFVIMPFSSEFDDVYALIKSSVETVTSSNSGRCFRLDETRPAGRITNRLLDELQSSDLCVADLTGCSPNVMWEVGYAMALQTPTIIITQDESELPFDLKDMQSIMYKRDHMQVTLGEPLKRTVIDTLQILEVRNRMKNEVPAATQDNSLIGELLTQVSDLKAIVNEAVKSWGGKPISNSIKSPIHEMQALEGHWLDINTGSNFYARVVNGDLFVPYSYGANHDLTAVFYAWERMDGHWFARYAWLEANIGGFAFLRNDSVDSLEGAWWYDDDVELTSRFPVQGSGNPVHLIRKPIEKYPIWAENFFHDVATKGLMEILKSNTRFA